MTDVIQISTTTPSRNDAEKIAQHLLQAKLAACIQITGPLTSKYWWDGNIESAEEWLCTIKTRGDVFARVERAIRENHPYDEPEIIAIEIVTGSRGYLDWIDRETGAS